MFVPPGLGVEGRRCKLVNVSASDAGTYHCLADNGVSPVATADVAVDIKCEIYSLLVCV